MVNFNNIKLSGMSWWIKASQVLLLSLTTTLLMNGGALLPQQSVAAGVANIPNCGGCHGYTSSFPDGTARNTPDGQFQGSHSKHVVTQGYACAVCHTVPATATTADNDHGNGTVDIAAAISGGTYGKASFATSTAFSPSSCTATTCHPNVYSTAAGSSPNWGAASSACIACHNAVGAFSGTGSGPATGSHNKHMTVGGTTCASCHTGVVALSTGGGATHMDGNIDVVNGYPTNVTKHAAGTYTGTCSAASCHANPYGTNTVTTPTWGTTATNCTACHSGVGAFTGTGNGPNTGSHNKHLTADAGGTCGTCHTGATALVTGGTNHLTGVLNVTGYAATNVAKHAAGSGYLNCTTASCHISPYGTAYVPSPTWGVSTSCGECHTGAGSFTGTGNAPNTGSHNKHMADPVVAVTCSTCHTGAVAMSSGGTAHRDGNIDVANGYTPNVVKHAPGTYTGSCSAASCHVSPYGTAYVPSPTWGVSTSCGECHTGVGAFTGSGNAPATGSHNKHMAGGATCGNCHAGAVAMSSGGTAHRGGTVTVGLTGYSANPVTKHAPGTYTGTCSSASCHVSPYGTATSTTPTWGTTATNCTACHNGVGAFTGTGNGPNTGSHNKHLTADAGGTCGTCHTGATALVTGGTNHLTGVLNVTGYAATNVAKHAAGSGYLNCTTASCHISPYGTAYVPSPTWGVVTACGECHTGVGAFTGTGSGPNTGSHNKHMAASATCANCHTGVVALSSGGTAHRDGNIDVINGYPSNVVKHTAGTYTGTCSTASCHANLYGTGTIVTPTWGASAANCTGCHYGVGAFTGSGNAPATGSHNKHMAGGATCANCHTGVVALSTGGGATHRDGNIDVVNGYPTNVTKHTAGTYTGTCSTASCHSSQYNTSTVVTPTWGATGGCASCHSGVGAFTGSGSAPNTGSHNKHMAGGATCGSCHTGAIALSSGGAAHTDGNIDVINGYPANVTKHTAGTYTGTCSTASCHSSQYGTATVVTPTWGATGGCASCHSGVGAFTGSGSAPNTGSHNKHMAGGATCGSCHTGAIALSSGGTAHTDGNIDVVNGYPTNVTKHTAGSYTGTCSTATCHSSQYSTATVVTPTWGATGGCASCHTGEGAFTGTGSGPNTGSHNKHMAGGATCGSCHTGAIALSSGGTAHTDGNIDVINGYPTNVTKHAAGTYTGTCSTASCHGDPYSTASGISPTWGAAGAGCASCHSGVGAFTTNNGPNTGSHSKHTASYNCATCHAGAVALSSGGTAHGDGNIDVAPQGGTYGVNVTKHTAGTYTLTAGQCQGCHGAVIWGGTLGCIDCHNTTKVRQYGAVGATLSAVTTEFGLAFGHKKTGRGAVTDGDCIVCHLEGKYTTSVGSPILRTAFHMDGNISLRDPDGVGEVAITNNSGGAFTFTQYAVSYAAGSRTNALGNNVAEVVTVKFCMACHDSNGATNTSARTTGGTAQMPFGGINLGTAYTTTNSAIAAGGLINVKSSFASTNSSRHPVGAPNKRVYPFSTRLLSPYNGGSVSLRNANTTLATGAGTRTIADSVVLVCDDCHTTGTALTTRTLTAHGATSYIRGASMLPTGNTLCLTCHIASGSYMYNNTTTTAGATAMHGLGSGGSGTTRPATKMNQCNFCHFSTYTAYSATQRPRVAQDVHGFNTMYGTAAGWTTGGANGMRPVAFFRNNANWPTGFSPTPYVATTNGPGQFNKAAAQASCGGSFTFTGDATNCSANTHGTYGPSGSY